MVRFSSFNALQDLALGFKSPGAKLGSTETFGVGAGAGLITVCKSSLAHQPNDHCRGGRADLKLCILVVDDVDMTMPFDNIKTRMQALGGESRYANSLDCFTKVRLHCLAFSCF